MRANLYCLGIVGIYYLNMSEKNCRCWPHGKWKTLGKGRKACYNSVIEKINYLYFRKKKHLESRLPDSATSSSTTKRSCFSECSSCFRRNFRNSNSLPIFSDNIQSCLSHFFCFSWQLLLFRPYAAGITVTWRDLAGKAESEGGASYSDAPEQKSLYLRY